ncbi:NADH-quinone oxidoreductase subunit F [Desulfosarcina sp.]|uniref:complex I 51 kDa subunit family protein n=1 Tax=Desulfosarcina sp. TaxID=2027861 RepID=UPI0029BEDA3E|nr:NADH-ubiquinone oxidoreductase-F iron-sulfur binding region domain-containing protein [Desulfosarcina sp.]MDX2453991.1 NADH-ubiquinone oxidoreductase-F iron-sulfur binding region domain-containing protein [Desulfosarcina sp.]MDX2491685.1 NADH-ubiquinone oxidoreductase-F iron-sulfur binding region domain-containing protein [Desulfosarcina sp.]
MTATYPQVLLKHRKPDRITTLAEYREAGGYEALRQVLTEMDRQEVKTRLSDALLLGRGGAGFPAGIKVQTVAEDAPFPRYMVCNADEMEPGTFKDRVFLHAEPHMLIEGMTLAAYSIKASHGIIFIRPEYESAARILEREIDIARREGWLGERILDSDYDFEIVVHRSGGRYICGEVTAQINALQGIRPNPKQPPPYATDKGLWGKPTLVNNVETLACIPHIVRNGAQWFKDLALSPEAAGTKLFCISGKVNKPGCYELPLGIKLSEIIETCCGGMKDGATFKACLPGGASTGYLTPDHYHIAMDFESLKKVGNRLGTGAVMVFDHHNCMVAATLNLTEFFARESCGWCTPCREGFPYLRDLLWRIENGQGGADFIPMMKTMCRHLWKSYCAFAPGGVASIESLLVYFEDEVMAHIEGKGCPFKK